MLYSPKPGEEIWWSGDEVDGVHGVSDDLSDGPGEQQHGEPDGELGGGQHVEDEPGDIDPAPDLLDRDHHTGPHQARASVQDLQQCSGLEYLQCCAGRRVHGLQAAT